MEIDIVKRKGEPIDEAEKERALAREQQELDEDTTVVVLDACPASVLPSASTSASTSTSTSAAPTASVNAEQNNNHNARNNNGIGNNTINNNNNNDGQQIASELGKHQLRQTDCLRLITLTDTLFAHEHNHFLNQHDTLMSIREAG